LKEGRRVSSTPKFSVLEYVTLDLPFAEELAAFRAGGATGVGVTEFTGPKGRDVGEMRTALREAEMAVTVCWPEVPSILPLDGFPGSADPLTRTRQLGECIKRLSELGPIGVACLTGAQGTYDAGEARKLAVAGLAEAAEVAAANGVKLGIEPIHHSISTGLSLVSTIGETADLIVETGAANLGIMFDVWHVWDSSNLIQEILDHAGSFLLVHVCDWREPTRSWADRVLPGDGAADFPGILGALEAAGFDGWYELEVISDNGYWAEAFPDSLWSLPPDELVRMGHEAFLRCWEQRRPPT
jgi:sugar phosphate isomerase/epimerase